MKNGNGLAFGQQLAANQADSIRKMTLNRMESIGEICKLLTGELQVRLSQMMEFVVGKLQLSIPFPGV